MWRRFRQVQDDGCSGEFDVRRAQLKAVESVSGKTIERGTYWLFLWKPRGTRRFSSHSKEILTLTLKRSFESWTF